MTDNVTSERPALARSLKPLHVWSLAFGSIIGWGCFVLPGDSFLPGSGPWGTVLGFAVSALLLCAVAYIYAEMIAHAPVAGGEYAHTYIGFGPSWAFVCGWALVLGYISIIGANVTALGLLVRYLLPGVFEFGALYSIAGWDVYAGEVMLMTAAVLVFGYVNHRGIGIAGALQAVLALTLSAGVVALFCGSLSVDGASLDNLRPAFAPQQPALFSVLAIVAIAPWAFVGFDTVSQSAEEFSFSPRRSRTIMFAAIIWGALVYSLMTLAVAIVMPYPQLLAAMEELRASGLPAWATGAACELAYGRLGAVILALAMLAGVCTGIMGFYVATTRLMFSMGRGGILPQWFAAIHPRHQTPHKAILFTSAVALIVPWCGRGVLIWIVDMSSVGIGLAYLFTCLSGYRVLSATRTRGRGISLAVAVLGAIISAACILLLLTPGSPAYISIQARWAMLVWIVLGAVFYLVSRRSWLQQSEELIRTRILGDLQITVHFGSGRSSGSRA